MNDFSHVKTLSVYSSPTHKSCTCILHAISVSKRMEKWTIMLLLMMMISFMLSPANADDSGPLAPALYVFGDSLFDSGNNNLLPTVAKADFPPYGMSFHGGRPTGRFTNGRTVVDFIAEFLGLPYAPPYLSLRRVAESSEQVMMGLNFASGSCGILPQTGSDWGKCLTFAEQIDLFERTVKEELPEYYKNTEELSNYLSKSLFMISIGSNDYIMNYIKNRDTSRSYTPQSFATLLVNNLSQQLQRLYQLGARKVVTLEVGPIGCIPSTTRQIQHKGACVEEVNQLAILFNDQLAPMLQTLTSTLPHSSFILGHVYGLGYDAIINPSKYGLTDSSNPCCVTWNNGTSACIPGLSALACHHPETHYFFDGYHLTETVYKTAASLCFNGSSVCIPKNIKDLVSQV